MSKLCNQVPSLSLSRWRTLTLEKIKIGWVLWCIKLQTIVSCWEEYCESMHSWLLFEVWNITVPGQPIYIFNRENTQNFEPQNGPSRGLDFIALVECSRCVLGELTTVTKPIFVVWLCTVGDFMWHSIINYLDALWIV